MFLNNAILAQIASETADQRILPGWAVLLIAVAIIGLPFLFGSMLARGLKMKEYALKISLVLLALFLGIAPIASQYVFGFAERNAYQRAKKTFAEKERDYEGITNKGLEDLNSKNSNLQIRRRAPRRSQ